MGATRTNAKNTKAQSAKKQATFTPRKATFTVTKEKGQRVFHAVNKRAHTVCKKAGKRTMLTASQLKAQVGKGSYKFYQYNDNGALKPIKF